MLISTTTLRRRSFALAWRDRGRGAATGWAKRSTEEARGRPTQGGQGQGRKRPQRTDGSKSLSRARAPRDRGRRSVHDLGTAGAVIRCLRRARRAEAVGAAAVASVLPANSTALRAAMCQAAGFGLPVLP